MSRGGASLDDAAILEDVLDLKEVDERIVAVQTAEAAAAIAAGLGFGEQPIVIVDPYGAVT